MISVDIVYERSPAIGNGHYMRSKVLFNYLESLGVQVRHIEETNSYHEYSDVLIIDVSDKEKIEQLVDSSEQFVVTIEYYGNEVRPDLNFNVFEHFHEDRNHESCTGLAFAFIREEFKKWRNEVGDKGYLLLMIGANPTEQDLKSCLEFSSNSTIPFDEIKVILNHYSTFEISENGIEVIKTPDNIEELMANCKLAITSPGVATLELMYLGKPSFLYSLNARQENAANFMVERNLSLGSVGSNDCNIFETVKATIQQTVDDKGCMRIWDLIQTRYEEKVDRSNS